MLKRQEKSSHVFSFAEEKENQLFGNASSIFSIANTYFLVKNTLLESYPP